MDKVILEKIYTAVAGAVVSLIVGFVMRRVWKLATGDEPPDVDDPAISTKRAAIWFALSTVGVGLATIASKRGVARQLQSGDPGSVYS